MATGSADAAWGFTLPTTTPDGPLDLQGKLIGLHLGGNQQSGAFVFGGEALVDYSTLIGDDGGANLNLNVLEGHWLLTLAARAGVALDRAFVYASAGVAVLHGTSTNASWDESVPIAFFGGTIGGGVEVALNETVTLRLDARHYLFPKTDGAMYPESGYHESYAPRFWTVTSGVGMRF